MKCQSLSVIGDPIAHSLSPLLHNTMAAELGLPYRYGAERVAADELPAWLARVRAEDIAGFNATMPHKLRLVPLMDRMTGPARYYGAVNTVRNDGGVLTGHNTDGDGFGLMLASLGLTFHNARVTVLGAGGAAEAIVGRAAQDGAASGRVLNRTAARAETLRAFAPERIEALPLAEDRVPSDTEILINTIPNGNNLDWSFVEGLSKNCAVFDILYAPPVTELLRRAGARGMAAYNGLGMLIWQAMLAFSFFTGEAFDRETMAKTLFLAVNRNTSV